MIKKLRLLKVEDIEILFNWNINEKHYEYYTCRPLNEHKTFEDYRNRMIDLISTKKQMVYILVEEDMVLGKITLFDFNTRNKSAEVGYYLPSPNRGKGLGSFMLKSFIETVFEDDKLNLNKIYATTASNNYPSIKLLEKSGFKLDGRLREHYFIDENRYDQLIYSMLKREWIK